MEVSKEFIQAMNGVINGEKWTRNCCWIMDYIFLNGDKKMVKESNMSNGGYWEIEKHDMIATDWIKAND